MLELMSKQYLSILKGISPISPLSYLKLKGNNDFAKVCIAWISMIKFTDLDLKLGFV